jgi:hypothetical protein
MGQWAVVFEDGSVATSGMSVEGKLRDALQVDAEVKALVLAPGGGWILTREDGSFAYERLPTGLDQLLSRRFKGDPPIDQIAISGFGGWFVRFCDGYILPWIGDCVYLPSAATESASGKPFQSLWKSF